MERRNFENAFKDAFDGAEVTSSENVWTNIELELEKAEGGKMKRRLMFYKLLAAASVAFAMSVSGIGYYVISNNNMESGNRIASNERSPENDKKAERKSDATENNPPRSNQQQQANTAAGSQEQTIDTHQNDRNIISDKNAVTGKNIVSGQNVTGKAGKTNFDLIQSAAAQNNTPSEDGNTTGELNNDLLMIFHASTLAERKFPAFYNAKVPTLDSYIIKPDPGALLLARLADEERRYAEEDKKEEKNKSEKLWTSLGFAAGGFSSVNQSVATTSSSSASNSTVSDEQSKASGVAYSYGVNVGTRISKRWVLHGGVNYLTQSSDYASTDNNLQSLRLDNTSYRLAPTANTVNNNVRFFSVPVQAGYLLVNKKFSLQLNGGVSTDLFLQNTITSEGGSLDKTTQGRGDDSPYRSVNFSGLLGTELIYKFGQRYRIALNPGLRYPLNSVYKSDVGIQSTPLTFDVGLRFRYIFH